MTEIIVARPVIPAIFAFHSAILAALRYRAAPKLFEASAIESALDKILSAMCAFLVEPPELRRPRFPPHNFFS